MYSRVCLIAGSLVFFLMSVVVLVPISNASELEANWFEDGLNAETDIMALTPAKQSKAWATCAVAFDLAGLLFADGNDASAVSEQEKQRSNGAKLASGMTFVFNAFENEAPTPEVFQAKWKLAKLAMESNYTTISTSVFASIESNSEEALAGYLPTYQACIGWLEPQQIYVDFWRELYGSGLLQ